MENKWNYKKEDIEHKFHFFNVLKDGRIHVLLRDNTNSTIFIPPTDDPITGVKIKDVVLSDNVVSVRMFLPPDACSLSTKLPVLYYMHGGGFLMCSAFSVNYTRFLTRLVAECNVIAVSVEYGLFPARPLPACYEDCWFGLQWLASHGALDDVRNSSIGPCDPWITDYADLNRIIVGGDSAGGNICHTLLTRVENNGLPRGSKVEGMILIHTYFNENDKMWMYMCPTNEGPKDRRMKPAKDDLARLGCNQVLVFVAEKDLLKYAGVNYVRELKKSGWKGCIELVETKGRGHCFLISNCLDYEAVAIYRRINSFINRDLVGRLC